MNEIKTYPILWNIELNEIAPFLAGLTEERKMIAMLYEDSIVLEFVTGVRVEGQLAGIAALRKVYWIFRFSYYVIKSEYQGRGLSAILTQDLIKYAKQQKYCCIMASVYKYNKAAKIWIKQGYKLCYRGKDNFYRLIYPLNWKGNILYFLLPIIYRLYFGIIEISKVLIKLYKKR